MRSWRGSASCHFGAAAIVVSVVFVVLFSPAWAHAAQQTDQQEIFGDVSVTALGRLEPKDGIRSIAGPAFPVAVVELLLVDKGDAVEEGQVIVLLEGAQIRKAEVDAAASSILELESGVLRAETELRHLELELKRFRSLRETQVVSESMHDSWEVKTESGRVQVEIAERAVATGRIQLELAEALLERMRVRSPISGRVIDVHARNGERVGPRGLLDLGMTDRMYAIAEVYETDIGGIKLDQRARITSAALDEPLYGTVDRISMKVGKVDVLGTDPAARTDARVVEVEVRLDRSDPVSSLTYLEVEVSFERATPTTE